MITYRIWWMAAVFSATALNGQVGLPNANASSLAASLGGKVVMDDGSPVPPRVAVLLSCDSKAVPTYTTTTGQFSFPPMNSATQDCLVRASVKGYTSEVVNLMSILAAGSGNVGVIKLHKIAEIKGVTTSDTSAAAPKDALKAYEAGMAMVKKGKPEAAGKDFEKATSIYPKYADAWYQLGRSQLAAKANDAAVVALKKAMEIDPLLVGPQVQLGVLAGQKKDWAESARLLDAALELDPVDYPTAWFPDAVANLNLGKFEQAVKAAREAVKADPQHTVPRAEYVLGMALAETKDMKGAAAALKDYLAHTALMAAGGATDAERVKGMIAEFERQ